MTSNEDSAMKYRAWNWNVIECDGTDPIALADSLDKALAEKERPTIIIGRTIMGRGAVTAEGENFEGKCSTHGNPLSKSGADYGKTIEHLGGNPENPWIVFPEVAELYAQHADEQREIVEQRKREISSWAEQNPDAMKQLQDFIDGKVPDVDYAAIAHKPGIATRAASARRPTLPTVTRLTPSSKPVEPSRHMISRVRSCMPAFRSSRWQPSSTVSLCTEA